MVLVVDTKEEQVEVTKEEQVEAIKVEQVEVIKVEPVEVIKVEPEVVTKEELVVVTEEDLADEWEVVLQLHSMVHQLKVAWVLDKAVQVATGTRNIYSNAIRCV